jgi:hypothetical protein
LSGAKVASPAQPSEGERGRFEKERRDHLSFLVPPEEREKIK